MKREPAHRGSVEHLRQIVTNGSLVFCNADRLQRTFHCMVRVAFHPSGGSPSATNYAVYWHADRAIIIVLSDTGLPYCYMPNRRFPRVDRAPMRMWPLCHSSGDSGRDASIVGAELCRRGATWARKGMARP
jgi:hypothetical protein